MLSYTAEDAVVDAQDDQRFAFVQFRALAMRMNDLRGAPVAFEIPPGTAEHAYSATGAITGHHISDAAAKLSRDASIILDPTQIERLSRLQSKGSPLSDADSAMKRSIDDALAKGLNAYLDAGAATLAVASGEARSFAAFSKLSGTLGAAFSTPLTVLAAGKAARKAASVAADGAPESAPAPVAGASASASPDGVRVKSAEDLRQEAWLNGLVYDKPIPEGLASASARAVGEGVPAPLRRQMIRASAGLALGGEKVIELKKNMSKRRRRGAKAVGHVGEVFLGLSAFEHAWAEVHERREKEKKELEEAAASKAEKGHVLDELRAEGMVGPSFSEPNKAAAAPDAAEPAPTGSKLIDSLALSGLAIAEKISDLAAAHDILSSKAPQEPPADGLLADDGLAPALDLRKLRG